MRPVTLNTSDASGVEQVTPVCAMDIYNTPFNVSLFATVTGAATFTVEYTGDDVFASNFNPATAKWYAVTGMSAISADTNATLISPVTGVRMRQTAGAGAVKLRIIEAGVA